MAVLALTTTQAADGYRGPYVDDHVKIRYAYINLPAVAVAGDIGTTVKLVKLPPGRVRMLPGLTRLKISAFGASRTLAIGHRAYTNALSPDQVVEPENASAFNVSRDVSTATDASLSATVVKYDLSSKAGVEIFATVAGGTIPVGATIEGYVAYLYE